MSFNSQNNFSVTAGRDGSRSFRGDHDDRWNDNSSRGSRGNFRGNRGSRRSNRRGGYRNFNSGSSRFRNTRLDPGNLDDDGDISMAGDSSSRNQGSRFNPYSNNRSRGSNRGHHSSNRRSSRGRSGPSGGKGDQWFKIMVPFGSDLSQDELYGLITSGIEGPFEPFKYSKDEKRAYFYVKGRDMADSLRSISRRITKPDGHKLVLHVEEQRNPPADLAIDPKTLEKLTLRMSDRYDPATQLLNLSALFSDEGLTKENIFLPLNRSSTMAAVTKIVREHIPELTGLDVSKNKLLSLYHMSDLVKAAPGVVSLNLGQNHIRAIDELDKLKGWTGITELVLDGNDLCNSFSSQSAYISAVRKKFPKVVKLDGQDLPPPITFDLETTTAIPPTQGSYFVNNDVKNLVVSFVKEYYSIYDTDRRKDLVPAYHDEAQFSYFVAKNPVTERQLGFHQYIDESRNLKKIGHYDADKLAKKIKTGVLAVVSCLESMPKTTHDVNSFTLDVSLAVPTMLCFVLHGVFKENDSQRDRPPIRNFSRTFITVPSGAGMVIINDMLSISNASVEQQKNAFKSAAPTPSSSPVSSTQAMPGPSSALSGTVAAPILTPEQIQMVERFTTQSGMNAEFSLKCLQENAWDYQRAGKIFTDLNSQGKIPPEAFVKS